MVEEQVGKIIHYFGKISVGIVEITGPQTLKIGDKIHIKGHTTDFTQEVTSMQYEHKDITEAKIGDQVGIKVDQPVREKDIVYKILPEG